MERKPELGDNTSAKVRERSHYHIHWSSKKELDWESFDTPQEAESAAKQLVRPGESYSIEQFGDDCPWCQSVLARTRIN